MVVLLHKHLNILNMVLVVLLSVKLLFSIGISGLKAVVHRKEIARVNYPQGNANCPPGSANCLLGRANCFRCLPGNANCLPGTRKCELSTSDRK